MLVTHAEASESLGRCFSFVIVICLMTMSFGRDTNFRTAIVYVPRPVSADTRFLLGHLACIQLYYRMYRCRQGLVLLCMKILFAQR